MAQPKQGLLWESDRMARTMRRRIDVFWNHDYLNKIIIPLLNIPVRGRVLDVGCGCGGLGLLLAHYLPSAQITGIDTNPTLLTGAADLAFDLHIANTSFQEADAYQIPFESDHFDAVVCQTVLTHLSDPAAAIEEMTRVLKPGGVMMAVEYHATGIGSSYNNTDLLSGDTVDLERFQHARFYIAGKCTQGRGDDTIGVRVPQLMLDAGLGVFDVRMNDRVFHAIPPYAKPLEQKMLERLRDSLDHPPNESRREFIADTLIAGGANHADVQRYFERTQHPEEIAALREALSQESLVYVSTPSHLYIILATKTTH